MNIAEQLGQLGQPLYQQRIEPWRVRRWRIKLAGLKARKATIESYINRAQTADLAWCEQVFTLAQEIAAIQKAIEVSGFTP